MVSNGRQMLGLILALAGFVGTILMCSLPAWRVSAFIGANLVTFQIYWEGLWMNCVVDSTGEMQCLPYDSPLALDQDLQAARAMVIIAIIAGISGIMLSFVVGGKCTSFVPNESSSAKIAIASGVVFIVAGLLVLIPVAWTTNAIIRDFYNPALVDAQRRELGASLYIGWASAGLLFLGGGLLCSSCPPNDDTPYHVTYSPAKSVDSSKAYV
uniref:Claudin n=1 Tax=Electrophorus electricus TaxID=8005 RepID=A0AAY5F3T8_ELEEL